MRIRKTTHDDPKRCGNCLYFMCLYRKCRADEDTSGYAPCEHGECIYEATRLTNRDKTCDKFIDRNQCLNSIRGHFGV